MKVDERRKQIRKILENADGYLTVSEIAAKVNYSVRTVHNDLDELEKNGLILSKKSGVGVKLVRDDFSENELEQILNAKAIISQSWSGVLFEDGTLFIEGALPGKHILRGGKPVVVRLPKLPDGFKYSEFVISGTTLYASWEESSFYTTGRSGFIQVNLDKTLYAKIL